jgi:hypothetical protein
VLKTILIASSALALSAGAALAQTAVSDIEQIGERHNANVTQSANADSFVFQANGNDNKATVEQRSNGNLSVVHQAGPNATPYSTVDPNVDNPNGPNFIGMFSYSNNNTATVRQTAGSDNASSSVNQSGNNNTATVSQTQLGNGAGFRAESRKDAQQTVYPDSIVDQAGFRNRVEVSQDGDRGRSAVYQGYTLGTGGPLLQSGLSAQTGGFDNSTEDNYARVTQTVGAYDSESEVLQAGDRNYATVFQSIGDVTSRIRQQGDANATEVYQQNVAGALSAVSQIGNSNYAYVSQ